MMPEALLEPQVDVIEHELRRVAQVVVPRDQAVMDDDAMLAQQPVADARVALRRRRIDLDAGDVNAPGSVAPHGKPRTFDVDLLQAQLEEWQRRPCDYQVDTGQIDERADHCARAITQPEAANLKLRVPAIPPGAEPIDLDRHADLMREQLRDIGAPALDARKHHETDPEEQHARKHHARQHERAGKAKQAYGERQRLRVGGAMRDAHERHNRKTCPIVADAMPSKG